MPTLKPRIALTPSAELKAVLDDFADALGKPTSRAVCDLLEEMQQQLIDLTKIARHVRTGRKAAAKRALQHMVGNALAEQLSLMKDAK